MQDVYVVGAAQSDFGAFPEESYRSLFATALEHALDSVDGQLDRTDIDEAFLGTLGVGGRQLGLSAPSVTEYAGLDGTSATHIENACAAGGSALRQAVQSIRAGMADVALAGGVEIMTDMSGDRTRYWLGVSGETEWERMAGTTFAGVYAQMADAHMGEYGTTREQLSTVAVKNHRNGAKNPHAHLRFECSLEDAVNGTVVADPLNLYDCCPTSDGAGAAILASREVAKELTDDPVRITGSGHASSRVGLFQRPSLTSIPASQGAAKEAYDDAGISAEDVDFAEVHDCFSIAELLAYEDLGFCAPGEAGTYIESGATEPDGERPVNLSGGLKSKGHPIGATGIGQAVEVFKQLRGEAGDRQADGLERGLTHNVGGSGGAVAVHVYEGGWA
ncbi:thiolase domain-containing protein [Haloarcula japonica]|uniref:Propanoyl-CoA C-acyltransferase n=1 Tax=Haloarcula japonica (strain ATCC 49778 / DSM 6131 / JCM 7785 / NBRC 101032 / NCIMB 13157 / TR-1) TaxID=1227453 RepID=M0L0A8_HALJT|nr:thiolase domain-containing protein [Haloarcula japonica]EMA26981.1 propanoyl-CoA C-acyltransferase [Haloarcula japonica DSM 6131]